MDFLVGIEMDGHCTLARFRPLEADALVEEFSDMLQYTAILIRKCRFLAFLLRFVFLQKFVNLVFQLADRERS